MSAPSREAQQLLDKLVELSRMIEAHRGEVNLELERLRLQSGICTRRASRRETGGSRTGVR